MKTLFTILLAGLQTLAIAQKVTSLNKSLDDNGEQLSIRVSGTVNGEKIRFNRTFKVAGMSRLEREDLARQIMDSILDEFPEQLEAPEEPEVAEVPEMPEVSEMPEVPENQHAMASVTEMTLHGGSETVVGAHASVVRPYTKEVRFNDKTGELFLRYAFEKDGEEFIYEKTADAAGQTDLQRQKTIRSFEREIALPGLPDPIP